MNPMSERHEANYIQSEGYQNQNSQDSFSHQSLHDPNDSEKLLTELNNDVKNNLEHFKRCIRSMRTVHWKLYDNDNRKTTGVLPNKKSKTVNQEPQTKIDLEKSMTKFLDDQRVSNIFVKNNFNDMILKMKQNEKDFQTKIKNMERKIDEWSKSQNVSLEQTDSTNPLLSSSSHRSYECPVFTRMEIMVCVMEENERIHEDKKLKRRSKLKIKIPRHLSTVLAITGAYELGLS
ncbi:hypothetical protein Tco_0454228 [Tanacetum coccineum]